MINGDHRTPGGRGNYLSCGISWPLSAAHGASEPSPKLSGLGVFINEPFQELATHLPASLGGSPTLPGQSDPAILWLASPSERPPGKFGLPGLECPGRGLGDTEWGSCLHPACCPWRPQGKPYLRWWLIPAPALSHSLPSLLLRFGPLTSPSHYLIR